MPVLYTASKGRRENADEMSERVPAARAFSQQNKQKELAALAVRKPLPPLPFFYLIHTFAELATVQQAQFFPRPDCGVEWVRAGGEHGCCRGLGLLTRPDTAGKAAGDRKPLGVQGKGVKYACVSENRSAVQWWAPFPAKFTARAATARNAHMM
jgi:hypothetical protein